MKYIKKFEAKSKDVYNSQYDFWNDYQREKIRDVDHYMNIINGDKYHVYLSQLESLFHWSCMEKESELALAFSKVLPESSIVKLRSIYSLDYKTFKTIVEKNNLYKKLINNKELVENLIYYGGDDVNKLKLFQKYGVVFTQKNLENASYSGKEKIVKYLVSIGLDPFITRKASYSDAQENCLDLAAYHNKTPEVIKYFVEKLNIPVTYRHMKNVIKTGNLEALPILLNSKNLTPDYAASGHYSTHRDYAVTLADLISFMCGKNLDNLDKYIKILLSREKDFGYSILVYLPSQSEFNRTNNSYENNRISDNYLDLAYWVISKYKGVERADISQFITLMHDKFWLKKMKENPSIISKLRRCSESILKSYAYQKIVLDNNERDFIYIIKYIHTTIISEYDHIPEIFDLQLNKYNL